MPRKRPWLDTISERIPGLLLKVGGLCLLCLMLQRVHPIFAAIGGSLIFLLAVFGFPLLMMSWSFRVDRKRADAAVRPSELPDAPSVVPESKRGRRTWKHDVYDDNAYAILGVPQDATLADIRNAFKKLALKYHPDAVPEEEKERAGLVFEQLDKAYQLLIDPKNRARYDAWIEHLYGREPRLEKALAVFADPHRCIQFDDAFRPNFPEPEEPTQETPSIRDEPAPVAPEVSQGAVLEVDIPESVRQALDTPAVPLPAASVPATAGTPFQIARCDLCGDLFETEGAAKVCDRCRRRAPSH